MRTARSLFQREVRCVFLIYANNEPKSALARDLGDCRDNQGKLVKRVFTCLRETLATVVIAERKQ